MWETDGELIFLQKYTHLNKKERKLKKYYINVDVFVKHIKESSKLNTLDNA